MAVDYRPFDYRAELKRAVVSGDTVDAVGIINEVYMFLQQALEDAARANNWSIVEYLLDRVNASCSGHLMEELLRDGHTEMAAMFVSRKAVWGSAQQQFEAHHHLDSSE